MCFHYAFLVTLTDLVSKKMPSTCIVYFDVTFQFRIFVLIIMSCIFFQIFIKLVSFCLGGIIPELDIYAIPSCESAPVKEIYFIAIIDVLTHYGVKKQAAKAAKTVKYGSNVDGISTCDPDQYAKRFIDFISKAIE